LHINIGDQFGQWTILEEVAPTDYGRAKVRRFVCRCKCGNVKEQSLTNLRQLQRDPRGCKKCKFYRKQSIKTADQAREILGEIRSGERRKVIAARHDISINVVNHLAIGKIWGEIFK
jgi:hypothetical protein